ncbi:MAG TPA: YggS family pyridoxal phosphate-dependent enzyme [Thermosulfurimonas dismutans]|uniref:Pyridoxal phosphate homeostasis protein n=1 Tax=Thermosulfurimonas dismutans TaxID=999894 RepID=A0A7C3GUP2_9BACT|nr:YggS family pyridoxal phosphate-dependent enzyme [Thermosulfurimonas dismutans]
MSSESVARRLALIRERVAEAALRKGRRPEEVKILGASKAQPPEKIREAVEAGLEILGENYVQEAEKKKTLLSDLPVSWHLIGYLQKNKARKALQLFDLIQTVDRPEIAQRLSRLAREMGRTLPVFIEVNLGGEETKAGIPPEKLLDLVRLVKDLPALDLRGLMTIPPYSPDPEDSRKFFRKLRELKEQIEDLYELTQPLELSMGMSHDYEVAVEEGATVIRIGTALFGPRPPKGGA